MSDSLGYDIFTFFFDTIHAPSGAHRIEWMVPGGEAPMVAEKKLRSLGVKVWSRQWETDADKRIVSASVLVAPKQRQWAEEILFVMNGYTPSGATLERTKQRQGKRYTPKRKWSAQPVASKTVVSGIMGILDKLGV